MKEKLYNALSKITYNNKIIPISQIKNNNINDDIYITYYLLIEMFNEFAENKNQGSELRYTIDLFTKYSDFDNIIEQIKNHLYNAGFVLVSYGPEIYDNKDNIYHIVMEVSIEKFKEEHNG